MKKISIIVPVYNVEKYIDKCVNSILNQTYRNLEVILVDDGSTDSSGAICDEYAEKDKRIIIIHKENGGLSSARNAGLDIATGDYIAFIDSDDYIAENMIEKLYNSITSNNADIAVCNYKCVDENGNCFDNLNKGTPIITTVYSKNDYFRNLASAKYWYFVIACCKLYKKELFENTRYPIGKLCEDNHIIDLLIEQCSIISSIEDSLYFYVQRNGSIMSGKNTKRYLDDAEAFLNRVQRAYLSNYECRENLIIHSLKNAARLLYSFVKNREKKQTQKREDYSQLRKLFNKYVFKSLKIKGRIKAKILLLMCVVNIRSYGIYLMCGKFFRAKIYAKRLTVFLDIVTKYLKTKLLHKDKVIVIFATPHHGNIGDAALAYSEKIFLKNFFAEYGVFEFTEKHYRLSGKKERKILYKLMKNDKLLIHSGGFLGTLWMYAEDFVREIISSVPNADITIMPQTIYYENNEMGRGELEKSKKIYNACTNFRICTREKLSYEMAISSYKNAHLIPDMVLYMNDCSFEDNENEQRNGISICLRDDHEKTLTCDNEKKVYEFAKDNFSENITQISMIADGDIAPKEREQEVNKQFSKFRNAELIITDRLHGMIFAAVTGTPCIVINSKSHKVKGCYDWISNLEYIKFADDINKLQDVFDSMDITQKYTYDNTHLIPYYEKLADIIRGDKL